jgi:CDP-paratose 2-epimerase
MSKLLVTGSSGLIGSEVVEYFCRLGWEVHGVDNNMRADFFGPGGDTRWNQRRLLAAHKNFRHHELDIRDRAHVDELVSSLKPGLLVHAAAQPSHDLAAARPFDDFDVNAMGTLNLLEAARRRIPGVVFAHMSTNKVYGDRPNAIKLKELPRRWDYNDPAYANGITEDFPIDQSKHSIFGASKVAGDVMVQEYGRYFGMKTCCLRGGCLTGPNHSGVELHGFLSYLIKCNVEGRPYKVFGYKGKQVRDNIHSYDVARFIHAFYEKPRYGEVYNIGGGRANSVSIFEAFDRAASLSGKKMNFEYVDQNRAGDHICYISDLSKMKEHYPGWDITKTLDDIFREIYGVFAGKTATTREGKPSRQKNQGRPKKNGKSKTRTLPSRIKT